MNFLIHSHNRPDVAASVPEDAKSLMTDIAREVLRVQPEHTCKFIANYLDSLLIVRENAIMSNQVLDNVFDMAVTVSDIMTEMSIPQEYSNRCVELIKADMEIWLREKCPTTFHNDGFIEQLIADLNVSSEIAEKIRSILTEAYRSFFYRWLSVKSMTKPHHMCGADWREDNVGPFKPYKSPCYGEARMQKAATMIQTIFRGFSTRKFLKKQETCAIKIQTAFRVFQFQKRAAPTKEDEETERGEIACETVDSNEEEPELVPEHEEPEQEKPEQEEPEQEELEQEEPEQKKPEQEETEQEEPEQEEPEQEKSEQEEPEQEELEQKESEQEEPEQEEPEDIKISSEVNSPTNLSIADPVEADQSDE